ncbi:MAG: cyclic lactone autoinducer peptide [Clostridia bacterium]|nr:cyclic lactone autoinducer peptide [Clostridia bacterium]
MKKLYKAVAKIAKKAAVSAAGNASEWGFYQPKEPKKLK